MKKSIKLFALLLALVFSLSVLVACNDKDDDDEPSIYPASNINDAEKALEENGYSVLTTELDEVTEDGETAMLSACKDDETITIIWYEDKDFAKASYRDLKKQLKEAKEELEMSKDDLGDVYAETKELLDNMVFGISGNMVWMATSKDAVKAAK